LFLIELASWGWRGESGERRSLERKGLDAVSCGRGQGDGGSTSGEMGMDEQAVKQSTNHHTHRQDEKPRR